MATIGSRGIWTRRAALILVTALGFVVVSEVTLRIFQPRQGLPPEIFAPSPTTGFMLPADYSGSYRSEGRVIPVETNSLGFRDDELTPKRDDRYRILFVGDSFVFGDPVLPEETFVSLVGSALTENGAPRPVETVNAGIPGFSSIQALKLFDETVDQVDPEALVFGLFLNDVLDNVEAAKPGFGRLGDWRSSNSKSWLRNNSNLYVTLRRIYNSMRDRGAQIRTVKAQMNAVRPQGKVAQGIELTEQVLADFAERSEERGLPFLVAIIPFRHQVYRSDWDEIMQAEAESPDDFANFEPNRQLISFARERGIPVLDLLPALEEHQDEDLYYDLHWTPRGHEVAAEAIAAFLAAQPDWFQTPEPQKPQMLPSRSRQ